MELRLVGAELFSADGQKDMTKLLFAVLRTCLKKYDLKYITKLTVENCVLLVYYGAFSGDSLPSFLHQLFVSYSVVQSILDP